MPVKPAFLNRMTAAVTKGLARPSDLVHLRQRANAIIQSPGVNGTDRTALFAATNNLLDAILTRQLQLKNCQVVEIPGQRTPILLKKDSVTYFTGTNQPNVGELAEPASIYSALFGKGTILTFDHEGKPTHARKTSGREIYIGELRSLGRMSGTDFPQTTFIVETQKMYFYPGTELTMTANKIFISAKIAVDHRLLNQDFRSGTVISYEPENNRFKVTVAHDHEFLVNGRLTIFKPGETLIINNKGEIVPDQETLARDQKRAELLNLLNARPTGAPAAEQEVASLREQLTKANRELQAAKRQNAILDAALAKPAYTVTEMIEEIKAQLAKLQEQWQTIDAAINTAEEAKAQLTVKLSGEEEASLMLNTRFSQQLSELEDRIAQTKSEHEQKLAADPMISACLRESVELTQLWAQTIDPRQKNLLQTKIEGKTNLLSKLRGGADRQLKADLSRLENEKTRLARESNTNQRHYASTIAGFNSQLAAREKEIAKKTEERARIGQELNQAISSLSSLINGINAALSATWQAPERDPE
ncbi:MAG: hypothetical protein WC529_09040 [Candidatus Margulisiibacteriota bacterium]